MKVRQYMTSPVRTVQPDAKISAALNQMESHKIHSLPVVSDQQLVGMITEDLIKEKTSSGATSLSIYELNYLLDKTTVADVMDKNFTTISPDTLIEQAALTMNEQNLTVLPVVTDSDQVEGIVSYKDIFKALLDLSDYQDAGSRIEVLVETDRIGVLAEITGVLAEAKIPISHIFVNEVDSDIEISIQMAGNVSTQARDLLEARGYSVRLIK